MLALASQPSRITVAVQGGQTRAIAATGDYSVTINANTARLIISPGVLMPSNLQVTSGGNGSDIAFSWTAGAGATSYIIEVHDSTGLRRTWETSSVTAVYTVVMALADGGLRRSYTVRIASLNTSVGRSDFAELLVEDAAPAEPSLSITPQSGGFIINATNTLEGDYAGMIVWGSETAGVPLDNDHVVYIGYSQSATIDWTVSNTAYFRVARYDSFGTTDLNVSSEISATKQAVAGMVQTDDLPGTTYLGDDVVFYTVGQEFYQWNASALPNPTYERTAPTIANGQMYAIDLKAISLSAGELKLGRMQLDAFGYIRGGQSDYDTGNGFWLGYDTDDSKYKLSLSNEQSDKFNFDQFGSRFYGTVDVFETPQTNMVLNGDFAANTNDWYWFVDADIFNPTWSSTQGSSALGSASPGGSGPIASRYMTLIPGETYRISFAFRWGTAGGMDCEVYSSSAIPGNGLFYTPTDDPVWLSPGITYTQVATGLRVGPDAWGEPVEYEFTVPSGEPYCCLVIRVDNGFIDDVVVEKASGRLRADVVETENLYLVEGSTRTRIRNFAPDISTLFDTFINHLDPVFTLDLSKYPSGALLFVEVDLTTSGVGASHFYVTGETQYYPGGNRSRTLVNGAVVRIWWHVVVSSSSMDVRINKTGGAHFVDGTAKITRVR